MSNKQTAAMLDKKLDEKTAHTMFVCGIVMVVAVLIHDGDHIRQALNWGYHIPLAIWALNLTVYIFPVVTIFLAKSRRMSATLVGAIGGIFTPASFLGLHLFGSATGLWGVENWTVKKAEHRRIDVFELWCWRRLLRVPWTARRSVLGVLWKE